MTRVLSAAPCLDDPLRIERSRGGDAAPPFPPQARRAVFPPVSTYIPTESTSLRTNRPCISNVPPASADRRRETGAQPRDRPLRSPLVCTHRRVPQLPVCTLHRPPPAHPRSPSRPSGREPPFQVDQHAPCRRRTPAEIQGEGHRMVPIVVPGGYHRTIRMVSNSGWFSLKRPIPIYCKEGVIE